MGRGKAAPKIMMVQAATEAEDDPMDGSPLFQGSGTEKIHAIAVHRFSPVDEGYLGTVPADADEPMLMDKYGGGGFRVVAKAASGKILGPTRTITLSGEPKFQSKEALLKHKIQIGELPAEKERPATPAPPGGLGVAEMFALMSQGHAQQLEMMRLQIDHQRQEAADREARNRREAEEARARDRDYQATLLSIMKRDDKAAAGGPLEMVNVLMQGLNLGRKIGAPPGENEPQDPVTTFLANLPAILEQGRGLVAAHQPAKPGGAPPAPVPGRMYLDGPVAAKLAAQVKGLMGKGYTQAQALEIAEAALAAGVEQLATVPNAPATPAPPAPATPDEVMPPTPAPAARPPRKATAIRPRATRVR